MATVVSRRSLSRQHSHLATVPSPQQVSLSRSTSTGSSLKRPRSPDFSQDPALLKRQKAVILPHSPAALIPQQSLIGIKDGNVESRREQRRYTREQYKEEFKLKYTKAFPRFSFYFHGDVGEDDPTLRERLEARIQSLGGSVEDFFSKDGITHFITNQLPEDAVVHSNKENQSRPSPRAQSLLKSPIRLRGLASPSPADEPHLPPGNSLLQKAKSWDMKIWSVAKLESVLDRCDAVVPVVPKAAPPAVNSLQRLLESERLYGTSERDPMQKRHDFHYFSKGTYFVLVEDLREELATVHAAEYSVKRTTRDGKDEGDWPVLYCHPDTRGPFCKPDEAEFKRARKQLLRDQEQDREARSKHEARWERECRRVAEAERLAQAHNAGDLRRSVSMTNLRRRALSAALEYPPDGFDYTGDDMESANASGYLRSTYIAASGNSVSVTSTTGTTTSAGNSLRTGALPASLRSMQKQEVVTSLKAGMYKAKGDMGPPVELPQKTLRKSKSTTTMRLPKREEGAKPGYCENCRQRYADFDEHIAGRKHRKFATTDANFYQLDVAISRIRRPMRADYVRRFLPPPPIEPESSPQAAASALRRDLRSSSEVSDYLPQPQIDYTLADVGAPDDSVEVDM